MELIIPHINADFDALASALAASKLYPEAKLFFPGSQEKNVRDFFNRFPGLLPDVIKAKQLELAAIKRVILVDVSSADRLGAFEKILSQPHLEIIRFDHHHAGSGKIRTTKEVEVPFGANTTIMVQHLRKANIILTALEATLLALGIYEETGSLSFTSTEPEDLEAAAWLRRQGADLTIVVEFVKQRLNSNQQKLMDDLIKSRESHDIQGMLISTATAERDFFVEDLAILATRLKDIEHLQVLFVFCRMGTRTYLVARSSSSDVAVDTIVRQFGGGGGHPTAASAVLRETSLIDLKENLIALIGKTVKHPFSAEQIMNQPVITVTSNQTVVEAKQIMSRYEHSGLPVVRQGNLEGIITLYDVDKALNHGFKNMEVHQCMTTNVYTAQNTDTMQSMQQIMIQLAINHLPVIKNNKLIGMITRADLLHAMIKRGWQSTPIKYKTEEVRHWHRDPMGMKNLLRDRLPERLLQLLHTAGEIADRLDYKAYVVGGFVRDIFVKSENWDMDIVVDGDGIRYAKALAKKLHGSVKPHIRFGTAYIKLPDGMKLDIATARTEYYAKPAALPEVERASIKYDLYRRDFTINAMAIRINCEQFGEVVDFFGGREDLQKGMIRVLYAVSFVDDPTRIFRAVRFEQRFNFEIDTDTLRYIKHALKLDLVGKLSMPRIYDELMLILAEELPQKALLRLGEFGVLYWIHPKLRNARLVTQYFPDVWETFAFAILFLDEKINERLIYLMALFERLSLQEIRKLSYACQFSKYISEALIIQKNKGDKLRKRMAGIESIEPGKLTHLMKGLPIEVLLFEMARCETLVAKKIFRLYITTWRHVKIYLSGRDLKKMGYRPGPIFEKMLRRLLSARLDGKVSSRREEITLLQRWYPIDKTK